MHPPDRPNQPNPTLLLGWTTTDSGEQPVHLPTDNIDFRFRPGKARTGKTHQRPGNDRP